MRTQATIALTAGVLALALLSPAVFAQETEPKPADQKDTTDVKPKPKRATRLQLDVEKHADQVVEEEVKNGPPRFNEAVEVYARSPQIYIERFFGGPDLECGPSGGGPPTAMEMAPFRPHTSPSADLMALATLLLQQAHGAVSKTPPKARYYLYKVTTGERVRYELREDRIPDAWLFNLKNTTYELTEAFGDRDAAVRGWRKYEHDAVVPAPTAATPSWITAPCRPRR